MTSKIPKSELIFCFWGFLFLWLLQYIDIFDLNWCAVVSELHLPGDNKKNKADSKDADAGVVQKPEAKAQKENVPK